MYPECRESNVKRRIIAAMYAEDNLLPISALQHLDFCPRQCALIQIEQAWSENRFTAEGRVLHERVHEAGDENRGAVRISRGLRIRSLRLGLIGQADVVEWRRLPDNRWQPFPVEYKRGKPKPSSCDKIQLCAQALCLEEMLDVRISEGAIFYGQPRRRLAVDFDEPLRTETETISKRLHELLASFVLPKAQYNAKCRSCSLIDLCQPRTAGCGKSVGRYLAAMLAEPVEKKPETQ